jgi:hypothetical protein
MSALPPKADIGVDGCDVRFVPLTDSCGATIRISFSEGRLVSELHANKGRSSMQTRHPFPIAVSCRFIARLPGTRHGARRVENLPRP